MRRSTLTLAAATLAGLLMMASDASACHKKKCACPAPAPVCAPVVETCAPVKKHCGMKMFAHHKKATCAPAPVCETVAYHSAPMSYSAPVYASGQAMPSMQK